jgi:hypothetical protein
MQRPGQAGSDSGIWPRAVRSTFGDAMVAVALDQAQLGHWMHDRLGWHGHGWFGHRRDESYSGCALIQSTYGRAGNFEVVACSTTRLTHFWLDNDSSGHTFAEALSFGFRSVGAGYEGVGLIQSAWGTLEVVAVRDGAIEFFQQDGPGGDWHGPFVFRPSVRVTGRPGFVQGPWGSQGNYEVVVAVDDAAGGLVHLWRNNDPRPEEQRPAVDREWQESVRFGQGRQYVDVGILPSFAFVDRQSMNVMSLHAYGSGPQVDYFYRSDGPPTPWQWQGAEQLADYQMGPLPVPVRRP